MRKFALLLIVLLLGLVAGCDNNESASPTPAPATLPPTTNAPAPTTVVVPSGPATCVVSPFEIPVNPNIPPISEADHIHGPEDAPITFIEYADFQ